MRKSWCELADVGDGLTRLQRLILIECLRAQNELGRESVPAMLLYGRVLEHIDIDISTQQFRTALNALGLGDRVR